ncbi:MAG: prepilin peptidase [Lachnospiraceae bacterium]
MLGTISGMGILLISSIFDIKWKKIPAILLLAGGIWSILYLIVNAVGKGIGETLWESIAAILPGTGLLILSFLTEKKVGYGDGILLILLGILQGLGRVLLVFCVGLFLQSLLAVVLLLMKRADKQTCIPFVPFLLAAEIILLVL